MDFDRIFNVFSKRDRLPQENGIALTREFRVRAYVLWVRTFPKDFSRSGLSVGSPLWSDVRDKFLCSLGRIRLSAKAASSVQDDIDNFLDECSDDHFLDFIEFSFQSETIYHSSTPVRDLIAAVNTFFQEDDLPFFLTDFTHAEIGGAHPFGTHQIVTYPQIIRRDSEVLHQMAIAPALELLRGQAFGQANREFLNALEDYRKGDYGDCVTKCGSAYESVMKVIGEHKGWPKKDTARKLLDTVLGQTTLPTFLKEPLIQTAVIRNRLSTAHGAGTQPRNVEQHLAQYTINVTAAAILLLVQEVGR